MKQGEAHPKKAPNQGQIQNQVNQQPQSKQNMVDVLVKHLQSLYPQVPKNVRVQAVNPVLMPQYAGLAYRPGEQIPTGNNPQVQINDKLPEDSVYNVVPHELGHQIQSLMIRTPERAKLFMDIIGLKPTLRGKATGSSVMPGALPVAPYIDKGGVLQNPTETYADIAGHQMGAPEYGYNTTPKLSAQIMGQLIQNGLVPIRTPFS